MDRIARECRMAAAGESDTPTFEVLLNAAQAINTLTDRVRYLAGQIESNGKPLCIKDTTLYEITAACTCGGKSKHDQYCGLVAVVNLMDLPGFYEMFN